MSRILNCRTVVCLTVWWLGLGTGRLRAAEDYRPLLRVPPTTHPPAIDGRFSEAKWADAAAVTGFGRHPSGQLDPRQSVVYLTYDQDNLYVAVRSPRLPAGRPLVALNKDRDRGWYGDDVLEMLLDPWHDNHQGARPFFYFIGNSVGNIFDFNVMPGIGLMQNLAWNGHWTFRNQVDATGWTAELAVPIKDLQPQGLSDGDRWNVNFTRTYARPVMWTTWSDWGGLDKPQNAGTIVFDRQAPVVRLLSVAPLLRAHVGLDLEVVNVQPRHLSLVLRASVAAGERTLFQRELTADAAAGQRVRLQFDEPLAAAEANVLHLVLQDQGSATVFYEAYLPFQKEPPALPAAEPMPSFPVKVRYLPSTRRLYLWVNDTPFEKVDQVQRVAVDLLGHKDRRVWSKTLKPVDGVASLETDFNEPDGTYQVQFRLLDAKGQTLASVPRDFVKKQYPWLGARLGVSDEVLPPWTPIRVRGQVASVLCSDIRLGPDGLPAAIRTMQPEPSWGWPVTAETLARPVGFVEQAAGHSQRLEPIRAAWRFDTKRKDKVEFAGTARGAACDLTCRGRLEYDGFLWFDCTLAPRDGGALDSLTLEIPLDGRQATLVHVVGDQIRNGSVCQALDSKQGVLWRSSEVPHGAVYGSFVPFVWLGNEDRGLCWFAESDQGWVTDDAKDLLEIVRTGREVCLRVHVVCQPTILRGPRRFSFGLMPTPSRSLPAGWRSWTFNPWWPRTPGTYRIGIYPPGCGFWDTSCVMGVYPRDWERHRELMAACVKAHDYDAATPYVCMDMLGGANLPERVAFEGEWAGGQDTGGSFAETTWQLRAFGTDDRQAYVQMGAVLTPSAIDFRLWCVDQLLKRCGWTGIYEDNAFLVPTADEVMGYGYRRADGRLQPAMNMLRLRDYHKRLATIFHQDHVAPMIWIHKSTETILPALDFGTVAYDGEWREVSSTNVDFIDQWPLEYFRSCAMGRNWGLVPLWLPMSHYVKDPLELKKVTRGMLGLLMLHDILCDNGHADADEIKRAEQARARFGMASPAVRFYGYWSNGELARTDHPAVLTALWTKPGKILVVLTNRTRGDADVSLALAPAKLGQALDGCVDADDGRSVAIETVAGGLKVKLKVLEHDYRLLLFTGQKP